MGLSQDSERKRVFNDIGASGHISDSLALIASMRISPGPLGKSADPRSVNEYCPETCLFCSTLRGHPGCHGAEPWL